MANNLLTVGWREWLALPDLGLPAIKAKVDTGARTSALHAFQVDPFEKNGEAYVRFKMHPLQKNDALAVECEARLLDQRQVTDSGGHQEMRYVIETRLQVADLDIPIQITLTNRDSMRFRMLLGRQAMNHKILVDPAASFLCGKVDAASLYNH
jgi:hypothetical protein